MIPKAATILIVRDEPDFEVFMVRRASGNAFMPDAYVYPGGRLDDSDGLLGFDEIQVAAIRETFEEAGVLLTTSSVSKDQLSAWRDQINGDREFVEWVQTEGIELDFDRLVFFSHWITPVAEKRRYDTYFFLACAPPEQVASVDNYEATEGVWISPKEALARHRDGRFLLFPPTYQTLVELAQFDDVETTQKWAESREPTPILPYFLPDAQSPTIVMAGDPEYPQREPYLAFSNRPEGERRMTVVDGAWVTT